MKKVLISLFAVAAMVSCSNNEVVDLNQEAIAFGNAFVDNSTRGAVDPSYNASNLAQFNVYGAVETYTNPVTYVNLFDGDVVTKGTADYGEAWKIDPNAPVQYWLKGADYIFDAVVDATSVETDTNTGLPTSLTWHHSTQKDMLHNRVTTTGKPTTNNGLVSFTFTHLLSKIKFTVVNNTPASATNYRYRIGNINITDANLAGKCSVPEHTWTITNNSTYSGIADVVVASGTTEECANEVLLIPGVDADDKVGIAFNVNVEMEDGAGNWKLITTRTESFPKHIKLNANTAYNFKVTVGLNETIEFTAQPVASWTNAPIDLP